MIKKSAILLTASVLSLSLSLSACQTTPQESDNAMSTPASVSGGDRLAQLEQRVGNLEQKMVMAEPTLAKVELMETKFRTLSFELGNIDKKYQMTPMAKEEPRTEGPQPEVKLDEVLAPKHKPVATPAKTMDTKSDSKQVMQPKIKPDAKAQVEPVASGKATVTSVRIGEPKKDVTRIVLDTTKPAEMKYDLDNGEHILVVDLPGNAWSATKSMTLKSSPMVKSFSANSDDGGSHLILQLKQIAKVATTARLNPSGQYGHRVYLDIVPAK